MDIFLSLKPAGKQWFIYTNLQKQGGHIQIGCQEYFLILINILVIPTWVFIGMDQYHIKNNDKNPADLGRCLSSCHYIHWLFISLCYQDKNSPNWQWIQAEGISKVSHYVLAKWFVRWLLWKLQTPLRNFSLSLKYYFLSIYK